MNNPCCEKCSYLAVELPFGVSVKIITKCKDESCPCHQAKPEGHKENCKWYERIITGKGECNCGRNYDRMYPPEVSSAKEEKECDWCKNVAHTPCPPSHKIPPTLNEQKGESFEREFFEKFGANKIWVKPSRDNVETIHDIWSFIAAKKKEWEAQKEQAVKAEIRRGAERNSHEIETNRTASGKIRVVDLDDILSLLSNQNP